MYNEPTNALLGQFISLFCCTKCFDVQTSSSVSVFVSAELHYKVHASSLKMT